MKCYKFYYKYQRAKALFCSLYSFWALTQPLEGSTPGEMPSRRSLKTLCLSGLLDFPNSSGARERQDTDATLRKPEMSGKGRKKGGVRKGTFHPNFAVTMTL